MRLKADQILTAHVGSLTRPAELTGFLKAIDSGAPYDEAAYEDALANAIAEVVRQLVEAATGARIFALGDRDREAFPKFYGESLVSG